MEESKEKILKVFNESTSLQLDQKLLPLKAFRIFALQHYFVLQPPSPEVLKNAITSFSKIDSSNVCNFEGTLSACNCLESQEIHLFQVKKVFTEKFHQFQNIRNLKVPNPSVSKERLRCFVEEYVKESIQINFIKKN
ncbi:MAG: hypothetical protein FJZ56_01805 [Chlamydiae bacterium]|nr:hypothetical protein [Chlamydiota bacterium]